jgi:glycosyltransferase 2 family protein
VLRAGLLPGGEKAVVSLAVFYETLAMVSSGALLAGIILAAENFDTGKFELPTLIAWGLGIPTAIPLTPPVLRHLPRLLGLERLKPGISEQVRSLTWSHWALCYAEMVPGWALIGLSLWATLRGLGASIGWAEITEISGHWPVFTAAVALALVAGFVSLIPGGAGVREWVLMELLRPILGATLAFQSTLLLRIVWLLAELAISVILYIFGRTPRSTLNAPASDVPASPSTRTT